jgi:hypothetical protein
MKTYLPGTTFRLKSGLRWWLKFGQVDDRDKGVIVEQKPDPGGESYIVFDFGPGKRDMVRESFFTRGVDIIEVPRAPEPLAPPPPAFNPPNPSRICQCRSLLAGHNRTCFWYR